MGSFRDLTVAVAQDPAMLCFLDARKNVKGAPNENFSREIMELFTRGVGNYSEKDVREAARAFTGWNYVDTRFVVKADEHDAGAKTFLGKTGNSTASRSSTSSCSSPSPPTSSPASCTASSCAKTLDPKLQAALGDVLRGADYKIAPFMETVFLSKDFYSDASMGALIQSPVSLAISTYRLLGQTSVPGCPTSTPPPARSDSACWRRPPSPAGPRGEPG